MASVTTNTTTVTVGPGGKVPKGPRVPIEHSMPAPVPVPAAQLGYPQPQDKDCVIIKITPTQTANGYTITESSLQSMPLGQDWNDPKNRTFLYDFSAGTINLDANWLGGSKGNSPMLVEGYPTLPFITKRYNRRQIISSMNDWEIFVRSWQLKTVDPNQFMMQGPNAWQALPHPAPVFVNVPKFGVGMVRFWRWSNMGGYNILYYAIWKLTPLGVFDGDPYIGSWYEVFATWVKPLKWAISQYYPSYDACLIVTDDGTEFQWSIHALKSSRNPKVMRAKNALTRQYMFLATQLSIQRVGVPSELTQEEGTRLAAQAVVNYRPPVGMQQAYHQPAVGGGRMPPWASGMPDAVRNQMLAGGINPVGLQGTTPLAPLPKPAAAKKKNNNNTNDDDNDDAGGDDDDGGDTTDKTADVKGAKSSINLGATSGQVRLVRAQLPASYIAASEPPAAGYSGFGFS